jgi:hypothetical protein
MTEHLLQVLDLVGNIPDKMLRTLFDAGRLVEPSALPHGLYWGRNGGNDPKVKWVAKNLVRREWFAKIFQPGVGVNVRLIQDGSYRPRPSTLVPNGILVDMPFRITEEGLDYYWHWAGKDSKLLQFRDVFRAVRWEQIPQFVPEHYRHKVGLHGTAWTQSEQELLIAMMVPMAKMALATSPFAMMYVRPAQANEQASCESYLQQKRWLGSGVGSR